MSKYIDAEKLIAEIGQRKQIHKSNVVNGFPDEENKITEDDNILSIISSLQQEQPEVDLEKEYKSYMKSRKDDLSGNAVTINMKDLAHYFWNKGLNARKEE